MRNISSLITVLALSLASTTIGCATSGDTADGDEYADAQSDATSPGKLDLFQSSDYQWHFKVISGNGRTLLSSESYTSRTGALNGVLSTLDNGVDPAQYLPNQTSTGWNLHLRAANNQTIAFTQVYSSKSNATRAINSCVKAVTTYLDKREANTTGARVEVFETSAGFHFNLHASNGQVVLSSETYSTAAAAWNGAFAVQDAADLDSSFAVKTANDGRFFFTLTAQNGQVVGVSQLYTSAESARAGIASVKSLLGNMDLI